MILNEAQQRAVAHQGGHALVLAGAGTGKTATLIARAVELLQRGVRPDQIILVTFTRRATRVLRERLTHQVGEVAERMRVGTFHRICLDLMRLEPDAFELRSYTIIDEDDREQLKFRRVRQMIRMTPWLQDIVRSSPRRCLMSEEARTMFG